MSQYMTYPNNMYPYCWSDAGLAKAAKVSSHEISAGNLSSRLLSFLFTKE